MSKNEAKPVTEKPAKVAKPDVFCLCGCDTKVIGKKAVFAPGHDMKVKKVIIDNIKAKTPLFKGVSKAAVAYAKEKWQDSIAKSIKVNAGRSAVKGGKFDTAEAKETVFNAAIADYTEQLAA